MVFGQSHASELARQKCKPSQAHTYKDHGSARMTRLKKMHLNVILRLCCMFWVVVMLKVNRKAQSDVVWVSTGSSSRTSLSHCIHSSLNSAVPDFDRCSTWSSVRSVIFVPHQSWEPFKCLFHRSDFHSEEVQPLYRKGQVDGVFLRRVSLWQVLTSLQSTSEAPSEQPLGSWPPSWPRPFEPGYRVRPDAGSKIPRPTVLRFYHHAEIYF